MATKQARLHPRIWRGGEQDQLLSRGSWHTRLVLHNQTHGKRKFERVECAPSVGSGVVFVENLPKGKTRTFQLRLIPGRYNTARLEVVTGRVTRRGWSFPRWNGKPADSEAVEIYRRYYPDSGEPPDIRIAREGKEEKERIAATRKEPLVSRRTENLVRSGAPGKPTVEPIVGSTSIRVTYPDGKRVTIGKNLTGKIVVMGHMKQTKATGEQIELFIESQELEKRRRLERARLRR